MQYLITTDWMWFVAALLAGGVVGYWLRWRFAGEGGTSHLLGWSVAACLAGLAVAVLVALPQRADVYLETFLLLLFCYALGGLLGGWLRTLRSRRELARAILAGNAQVDRAVLGARAKAAVRSDQDAAAVAMEDAAVAKPLAVEPNAAELVAAAAAAKAAEEKAAEEKAAEDKAVEEERLAAEARAAEDARAAAKAAEDARLALEAKAAEVERMAAAARAADEERRAAAARAAEDARLAAAAKAAEDARLAFEAKAAEVERLAAAAKAAGDGRLAADASKETRLAAAVNAVQKERLAVEAKAAEVRMEAAVKVAGQPDVAAMPAVADEFHPGVKPQGLASPEQGEVDDLKLIKGIGPKLEKACHALGIYQFGQIADWTPDEAIWVGHHIASPGRVEREHWIAQAKWLAAGGETQHSSALKSGAVLADDKADEPLDPATAESFGKSLPREAAAVDGEGTHPGRRPYGLVSALGKADNLKRIRGIGPQNEARLHGLGIWHFSQMAAWTDENVKWVGSYLAFSGRIHREKWIAQARELAAGKDAEVSRGIAAGKVAAAKADDARGQNDVGTSK
ncbi:cell envelope biogenesis protein TolA [Bradyrhizobium sp.]|uniref:cell envelope biogenesis protein TolA n=1 Tax=Bradyrhizobium sp. TaxID=376 RepID=UPI003C52AFFC